MKKQFVIIGITLVLIIVGFSGCINAPKELTPFSIVSFGVEPSIINKGEFANLSWVVLNASSVSIDNGIGTVTLTGTRIIKPNETTTYILTALNETTTKSATATITIIPPVKFDKELNITDTINDVYAYDFNKQETIWAFYQPDYTYVTLENLDIIKVNYQLQGTHATVSLKVRGSIQDKGKLYYGTSEDINAVHYIFYLSTLKQDYVILYVNQTGYLSIGNIWHNLYQSDFSVVGDTLTMSFNLTSSEETFLSFNARSEYNRNIGNGSDTAELEDNAPNLALKIMPIYVQPTGSVGETIKFSGSPVPFAGLLPYEYHWDFGDGAISIEENSTHVYTEAGYYTYTFTITDRAGDIDNKTGTITITV
jgi:hypothetical protein